MSVMPSSRVYNLGESLQNAIAVAFVNRGIDCVKEFNGSFAFAIGDIETQEQYIVRDRYGTKPVYYRVNGSEFVWAWDIAYHLGGLRPEVDLEGLAQYFTFQNCFDDRTLFKGIRLLPPGCYLHWDGRKKEAKVHRYWDCEFDSSLGGTDTRDVAEEVRRLLTQAVGRQMVAGAGCFLSGGMDTGSIATLAVRDHPRTPAFTCGFDVSTATGLELGFDETEHAKFMANHLKMPHYEVNLHAGDMEAVLPDLIGTLEDIRMGQCYPDYYTLGLASKFVNVVLSGGGGDELFGGYPWRYYHGMGAETWEEYATGFYGYWQRLIADSERDEAFHQWTIRALDGYSSFDVFNMALGRSLAPPSQETFINQAMRFEVRTFLHGLFVIGERMARAYGLDVRYPFMDNDLVDFALRIPPSMKLASLGDLPVVDEDDVGRRQKAEGGKVILRDAMRGMVPGQILARHKQGFSAPDGAWFRGESMGYVRHLLLVDPQARIFDYLRPDYVGRRFREHLKGEANHRLFIWSCLSFEWWLRRFIS